MRSDRPRFVHGSRLPYLVMMALVALIASPTASAQERDGAVVVAPAAQVTKDLNPLRAHNQPQMLVHPEDPNTLVIVAAEFLGGTCHVHVSVDGGRTWTMREADPQPAEHKSCVRPTFGPYLDAAFGPDGTLYVLAAGSPAQSNRGPTTPYMARSHDLGKTWEFSTVVDAQENKEWETADGSTETDSDRYSYIRMAVHPTNPDLVYAGFRYGAGMLPTSQVPVRSVVAVSENGGETWSEPKDIFENLPRDEVYGSDVPALAVAADGTIYAFTKERPPPLPPDTEAPTEAPPPGGPGAWERLLMSVSADGGKTWKGSVLDDTTMTCPFCVTTPEAAIDPVGGNIYVVFEFSESPPPNARDDRNIWFKRSTDGGRTFSDRIQLNDDVDTKRGPNYDQIFPGISIAPNGRIDVTWYDFRSDAAFNPNGAGKADLSREEFWDVYYTFSTDEGRSWAPNVRISDRSMRKMEGYSLNTNYDVRGPMGVAATDSKTHAAWADSRDGSAEQPVEDVYFATAFHQPGELLATSSEADFGFVLGASLGVLVAGLIVVAVALRLRSRQPTAERVPEG